MEMAQTRFTGSGQSGCRTLERVQVELQNTPITHAQMLAFTSHIGLTGWHIYFGKSLKRQWGHCRARGKEILVNRRSVMVFLHELAHALEYETHKQMTHGYNFTRILDGLINEWQKNT